MAAKDDETIGCCCCAFIVVAVVLTIVGWVTDFVRNHPVWTAVIVLALIGLTILVMIAAQSDAADGSTPNDREAAGTSLSTSRSPKKGPTAGDARTSISPAAATAHLPTAHRYPIDRENSSDARHTKKFDRLAPPNGDNDDAHSPAPIGSHPDSIVPTEELASTPKPIMEPEDFRSAAKALLRRDQWAILGASYASARGGIDMVAARGSTIVAVQCHAPAADGDLDASVTDRLLSAPFDVHRIEEVILLSSVPVSAEAENLAKSQEQRIHLIDSGEFLEWHDGRRRLEPMWGLITPTES